MAGNWGGLTKGPHERELIVIEYIETCTHCGKPHRDVEVHRMPKDDEGYDMYFECPKTGKRTLLKKQ